MDAEAIRYQAEALRQYLARGGAASRWLESKDFSLTDRGRILTELEHIEERLA